MKKSKKCEDVIKQIADAFADVPRPASTGYGFGHDWMEASDDNMDVHFSKYKHWSNIPFELLLRYHESTTWLTEVGFRGRLQIYVASFYDLGFDREIQNRVF